MHAKTVRKSELVCKIRTFLARVQKSFLFCMPNLILHANSLFRTVWRAYMKKCMNLKSVKSNSLIHKITYVRLFRMLASSNKI